MIIKHKKYNNVVRPETYSPDLMESMDHIPDWSKRMGGSFQIVEDLIELKNEIKTIYDSNEHWSYTCKGTINNYIEAMESVGGYRKLLYDPTFLDTNRLEERRKNEKDDRPEIDLILFTDRYFGRKTFKLFWQPSNWKYKAFYDKEKRGKIIETYENKRKEINNK